MSVLYEPLGAVLLISCIGLAMLAYLLWVERRHLARRFGLMAEERDHLALLLAQQDQCQCGAPQLDGLHTFGHCDVGW